MPTLGACWQLLVDLTFTSCEDGTQGWLICIWVWRVAVCLFPLGCNILKQLTISLLLQKLVFDPSVYNRLVWGYPRKHSSSILRKLAALSPILRWLSPTLQVSDDLPPPTPAFKMLKTTHVSFLSWILCVCVYSAVTSAVHSNGVIQAPTSPQII